MFLPSKSMGLGLRCSSLCRRLWLTPVPGWRSLSNHTQTQILNPEQQPQREELPREKATPWLMLSSPSDPQNRHFYELTADDSRIKPRKVVELPDLAGHFCFGSSQGYIFTIPPVEEGLSPEIRATNPLTGHILPLPSVNLLPPYPFAWHFSPCYGTRHLALYYGKPFLSHSLDMFFLLRNSYLDIAHVGDGRWIRHNFEYLRTNDCVLYKGLLYAVGCRGDLLIFNPRDPMEPPFFQDDDLSLETETDYNPQNFLISTRNYLVVSPTGGLFLLYRKIDKVNSFSGYPRRMTSLFKVFKLHEKAGKGGSYKWEQVKSLGGLALFVGPNHSLSYRACDFTGILKPNSIYFTDDDRLSYQNKSQQNRQHSNGDTGVFCLDDGSIEYFEMGDGTNLVFDWPPPIWLVPAADHE